MSAPTRNPAAHDRRAQTANDLMKAQWDARVGWSIMLTAALHAAVIIWWPSWTHPIRFPDRFPDPDVIELLTFYDMAAGGLGTPRPAVAMSAFEDTLEVDVDVEAGRIPTQSDLEAMSDALRSEILRRAASRPTLAEAQPTEGPGGQSTTDEGPPSIGTEASTSDYATSLELSPLDLERLTAVLPEVALMAPTNWVLVRNREEVLQFLANGYNRGVVDRTAAGSVSVMVWVSETGSVEWAEISQSSGRTDLDELTLRLFSEVIAFRPARVDGVPRPISLIFQMSYPWF